MRFGTLIPHEVLGEIKRNISLAARYNATIEIIILSRSIYEKIIDNIIKLNSKEFNPESLKIYGIKIVPSKHEWLINKNGKNVLMKCVYGRGDEKNEVL